MGPKGLHKCYQRWTEGELTQREGGDVLMGTRGYPLASQMEEGPLSHPPCIRSPPESQPDSNVPRSEVTPRREGPPVETVEKNRVSGKGGPRPGFASFAENAGSCQWHWVYVLQW